MTIKLNSLFQYFSSFHTSCPLKYIAPWSTFWYLLIVFLRAFVVENLNGKTKMASFPGATSKEILHYLEVHLTNSSADVVILPIGVNDLLEDNSKSKIEHQGKNLRSMVEKCHTCAVKNVFILGLTYSTRIGLPVLERTRKMVVHLCNKLSVFYVDNRNIRRKHLWKDGLHLVEFGRVILASNFLS